MVNEVVNIFSCAGYQLCKQQGIIYNKHIQIQFKAKQVPSILMELSPKFLTTWIINISAHGDSQDLWLQIKRSKF